MDEWMRLAVTLVGGFALGYLCRWLLDRRSERWQLVKQVVERYMALPEPREGAAAPLERLANLQRSGAGLLSKKQLSDAAGRIRQFGRPDPLLLDVPFSAHQLLQHASSRGHTLGSALQTYDWIVEITTTPKKT